MDFSNDVVIPKDEELNRLSQAAYVQQQLEIEVAALESQLAAKKEELRRQQEEVVPNMMAELFLTELKLSNGTKVKTKKVYFGSIAQERAHAACDWLRKNEFGGLVKNDVTLAFGKGEDSAAEEAMKILMEKGYTPSHKEYVHPQTLKAWIKEMYEGGTPFPYDLFAAGSKTVSQIEIPKAKVK